MTEGVSTKAAREIMYDKLIKNSHEKQIALSVISYNCTDPETNKLLMQAVTNSYGSGRFYAYCLLGHFEDYTTGPIDTDPTKSHIYANKRVFGGAPPGSGVKNDLQKVFEELQAARSSLENLSEILLSFEKDQRSQIQMRPNQPPPLDLANDRSLNEEYMTSKVWLQKNGLSVNRAQILDVLNEVCFRHCDGVVVSQKMPFDGKSYFYNGKHYLQGDAVCYFLKSFV
jgi:hypothetical protein